MYKKLAIALGVIALAIIIIAVAIAIDWLRDDVPATERNQPAIEWTIDETIISPQD